PVDSTREGTLALHEQRAQTRDLPFDMRCGRPARLDQMDGGGGWKGPPELRVRCDSVAHGGAYRSWARVRRRSLHTDQCPSNAEPPPPTIAAQCGVPTSPRVEVALKARSAGRAPRSGSGTRLGLPPPSALEYLLPGSGQPDRDVVRD